MKAKDLAPLVRLRVRLGPGVDFGPGKADLLEGIRETGSISAAGRRMRMSYKRAWQLVDEIDARALRFRLLLDSDHAIGPGKTDLLAAIARSGSISAAARDMAMSYKRAWQLVDELNGLFDAPLVAASKGGSGGGGATLTRRGADVLTRYRRMHAACVATIAGDLRFLCEHRSSSAD